MLVDWLAGDENEQFSITAYWGLNKLRGHLTPYVGQDMISTCALWP
jgi:hypothetical protein